MEVTKMIKEIKEIKGTFCAGIILLVLSVTAEASLIKGEDDLINLIYDTDLDVTWLGFGNAAAGSSYDNGGSSTDGRMSWANANSWATDLNYLGFTNWRLPTAVSVLSDPSCDLLEYTGPGSDGTKYYYNCTGSEMGNLFYNGLDAVININTNSATFNETFFDGLLHKNYWSSTAADPECYLNDTNNCAWDFDFKNGVTEDYPVGFGFHALAVHEGDIGMLGAVPIPPAIWLFCCGLIGLMCVARQNTR